MKESKFKGQLSRCEVESVVNKLRGREPTNNWVREFNNVLLHFDVQKARLYQLAANSNKTNLLGHRYGYRNFTQLIDNFISQKGARTWTQNAQKTVEDHLDILVDYLSKPEEETERVPTLKERLDKERSEGKWPTVQERLENEIKNNDSTDSTHKVSIKRVQKRKKHYKSNKIYVTINIRR